MPVQVCVLCMFSKLGLVICSLVGSVAVATPEISVRSLSPDGRFEGPADLRGPLGSLWKIFVYAYGVELALPEKIYTCRGADPEEIFCCAAGESITAETALAKSCSPYFAPKRLSIEQKNWAEFWTQNLKNPPSWLVQLKELQPETRVNVDELLQVLIQMRTKLKRFENIEAAVLGTILKGTAAGSLQHWGSTLRVKTYTWRDLKTPSDTKTDSLGFTGGFAGWLPDGTALWVSRAGHGRDAFTSELRAVVDKHLQSQDKGCVIVNYFARYPIAKIHLAKNQPPEGPLRGPVEIKFKNGNLLRFEGDGSLKVTNENGRPQISARLSTNEYVARVLDREVQATPRAAAEAFAIAIRTFLLQNSKEEEGCRQIADSSHKQRVSPSAASSSSLRIARWSEGLVLSRVPQIRYHSSQADVNRMSWVQAKSLAEAGYSMNEILKAAYPAAEISFATSLPPLDCVPNLMAARWIEEQSKSWRRHLNPVAGFEKPDKLKVCVSPGLSAENLRVFSLLDNQQIFVPKLRYHEDEISILHEYLHIGFRHHPRGRDEIFIEDMAKALLEEK